MHFVKSHAHRRKTLGTGNILLLSFAEHGPLQHHSCTGHRRSSESLSCMLATAKPLQGPCRQNTGLAHHCFGPTGMVPVLLQSMEVTRERATPQPLSGDISRLCDWQLLPKALLQAKRGVSQDPTQGPVGPVHSHRGGQGSSRLYYIPSTQRFRPQRTHTSPNEILGHTGVPVSSKKPHV